MGPQRLAEPLLSLTSVRSAGAPLEAPKPSSPDREARAVHSALASSGGNVAKAARSLGITTRDPLPQMARYGLRSEQTHRVEELKAGGAS